jgi:hypothetical protein
MRRACLGFGPSREDAVSRRISGPGRIRHRLGRRCLGRVAGRLGDAGKIASQHAGLGKPVRSRMGDNARQSEKVTAEVGKITFGARNARLEAVPEGAGGGLRIG